MQPWKAARTALLGVTVLIAPVTLPPTSARKFSLSLTLLIIHISAIALPLHFYLYLSILLHLSLYPSSSISLSFLIYLSILLHLSLYPSSSMSLSFFSYLSILFHLSLYPSSSISIFLPVLLYLHAITSFPLTYSISLISDTRLLGASLIRRLLAMFVTMTKRVSLKWYTVSRRR